jgi:hypothetical protein
MSKAQANRRGEATPFDFRGLGVIRPRKYRAGGVPEFTRGFF